MNRIISACACALALLASGSVSAQQGSGSNQQGGNQQVPGRVDPLDLQFAEVKTDKEEKAKAQQEAEQRQQQARQLADKALQELNRQRQANETAEQYRQWQRQQQRLANQRLEEAQKAQGQANMAAFRANEAEARFRDFTRNNPTYTPPVSTPSGTNPVTPSGPSPQRPRITDPQSAAWQQLKALKKAEGFLGEFSSGRQVTAPDNATPAGTPFFGLGPNRPAPPQTAPFIENRSHQQRVLPSPGGVIIAPNAYVTGLKSADVASASFDAASGILTLALRSEKKVTCKLDPDDFAIAVRSVFDVQTDPTLSMSYDAKKPGFLSVDYTGPLFKTRFGKLMYEIDVILGSVIFNREGDHRAPASAVVPSTLVYEAGVTGVVGSRVFLLADAADFVVDNDRLVCRRIESKVRVTATDYNADYFEEAMHRVARVMDENFDALAEKFSEFKEFRRLAEHVAIAKWLKRHAIAFDWSALKSRTQPEHDFPAYVPAVSWYRLFNGQNLDGWRLNLASGQFESALKDKFLTLKPTGQQALQVLSSNWTKNYDLRYIVETEGPVEFILRDGSGNGSASVAIDTKGKRHVLELFLREGKWSVIGPDVDKSGEVTIPETKQGERRQPINFGMRVPPGSTLVLYAAAMRRW